MLLYKLEAIARPVWCVRLHKQTVKELRNALTTDIKLEFKRAAKPDDMIYRIVHHIVPLSLGGSNDPDNLCLVEPELHKAIHQYIDVRNKPMRIGQRGYVWVPVIQDKVFNL